MTEIAGWIAVGALLAVAPMQEQAPPAPLRTFIIEKPAADPIVPLDPVRELEAPVLLPSDHDRLFATLGLGYVQGADWGAQMSATGAAGGVQIGFDALVTKGWQGVRFDYGTVTLSDPDLGWRADAGDIFSPLRGASRGVRASFAARGDRRPSIAVYASRPGTTPRPAVVAFRDQLRFRGQTLLDAEIASDGSTYLATEWALPFFSLAASWRALRGPYRSTDRGFIAEVPIARGVTAGGSLLVSDSEGEAGQWRTIFTRVPVARWLHLTLERTFAESAGVTQAALAISGMVNAQRLRMFHRLQWGQTTIALPGTRELIERQQIQSMASYDAGPRVQLTVQMATGWSPNGAAQHWEELQSTVRLSRTSTLQVVAAVPDLTDTSRLRARFTQQLPRAFAIEAEVGQVTAFQSFPNDTYQSRARVMVSRTFGFNTPARGGAVAGYVVDHANRPVTGARVRLGPYAAFTDGAGLYVFSNVPRGEYELSLDSAQLPAAFASDGRNHTLTVTATSRVNVNLHVAPLNAVHGRVWADRNANGRFDAGEGVGNVVVRMADRVLATGDDGNYSFYNVWPGPMTVTLDVARLAGTFLVTGPAERAVVLGDDAPVTGVDFQLTPIGKPIQWRGIGK